MYTFLYSSYKLALIKCYSKKQKIYNLIVQEKNFSWNVSKLHYSTNCDNVET